MSAQNPLVDEGRLESATMSQFWAEGEPRELFVSMYVKGVSDVRTVDQTVRCKYYLYIQWKPSEAEYHEYMKDPNGFSPDFLPKLMPSNTCEIHEEKPEIKRGTTNPLHLLEFGNTDVWGEEHAVKENQPLFALATVYDISVSADFQLHRFPLDVQVLRLSAAFQLSPCIHSQ